MGSVDIQASLEGSEGRVGKYFVWRSERKEGEEGSSGGAGGGVGKWIEDGSASGCGCEVESLVGGGVGEMGVGCSRSGSANATFFVPFNSFVGCVVSSDGFQDWFIVGSSMVDRFNRRSINDGVSPCINSSRSRWISASDIPAMILLVSASISRLSLASLDSSRGFTGTGV